MAAGEVKENKIMISEIMKESFYKYRFKFYHNLRHPTNAQNHSKLLKGRARRPAVFMTMEIALSPLHIIRFCFWAAAPDGTMIYDDLGGSKRIFRFVPAFS